MDKIQIIEKLFYHIVIYSYLFLPLTWLFHRTKDRVSLSIAIYGVIVFLLLKAVFEYLPFEIQLIYLDAYTLSEFLFFTFLLSISIQNKRVKQIIFFLSFLFVGFLTFQIISQAILRIKVQRLDSISVGIETILLFIFIFLFFYDHSKYNRAGYIYNHQIFWISVGILMYLGGSLFFNILANYMTSHEFDSYWHYTYIAETLKNILFSLALLISSRQSKSNSLNQSKIPYLDLDMN